MVIVDKFNMMTRLLPSWLARTKFTPADCAEILGLGKDADKEIPHPVLYARVAARDLNLFCNAFVEEIEMLGKDPREEQAPVLPKARHSRHIGQEPAA